MKSTRTLIIAGIACYAILLLTGLPARLLTAALPAEQVATSGVSGTVWNGRIDKLTVARVPVREFSWRLSPSALLAGRASLKLDGQLPGGEFAGNISVSLGQTVRVRAARGRLSAAPLGSALGLAQAAGTLEFDIDQLDLRNGWPSRLIGTASVAGFPLMPGGAAPGSFAVAFEADEVGPDGSLSGVLSDQGGPVEVSGNITLMPPADYELSGIVRARNDAPPDLVNGLNLLGPPDAEGRRQFSLAGSI